MKFLLSISCLFLNYLTLVAQVGTLTIDKLHFDSSQEEKIFNSIRQNQEYDTIELFLAIDSTVNELRSSEVQESIELSIQKLRSAKQPKTLEKTVQNYFDLIHKEFFVKYKQAAYFNEIFESGSYNCVTASAFYAIIFNRLGISFDIKETPNHVYLVVNPGKENILIESTDPAGSLIVLDDQFQNHFLDYLKNEKIIAENDLNDGSAENIFYENYYPDSSISMIELAGIQYYNLGIEFLIKNEFRRALYAFEKSYSLYPAPRTAFLIIACLEELLSGEFSIGNDVSNECLVKYVNYSNNDRALEVIQNLYEKQARELLLNQNDQQSFESFHLYLANNINDSASLSQLCYIRYFYLGTSEALKSNFHKSLQHLRNAAQINPENLMLHSITTEVVLKYLMNRDDPQTILDSLERFADYFKFLEDNSIVQSIYCNLYLQLSGDYFNNNFGESGLKYIEQFELYFTKFPDLELNEEMIGWAYGEASSYFIRKGNKTKAKLFLENGLNHSPDNPTLNTKMSYLKYF